MKKLTTEQADWLIEEIHRQVHEKNNGITDMTSPHFVSLKINQCTEKEFPAFSFETQDHRIISMHQVVNRAALNNEFFLDKAELMHLVLGIEKIIDWMEEQE